MFFYGRWERRLDDKRRIIVPAKFKKTLGDTAALVLENGCLLVFPKSKIQDFSPEKFPDLWINQIDKQGRLMVPAKIYQTLFPGCQRVIWEGRKDHFKVFPCHQS